jgi:primosomal protein N'
MGLLEEGYISSFYNLRDKQGAIVANTKSYGTALDCLRCLAFDNCNDCEKVKVHVLHANG